MKSALISLAFFLAAAASAVAAGSGSNNADISNNVGSNMGNNVGNGAGSGTANGIGKHYIDSGGNQWTYIVPKETPSNFFFTENIPYWADASRSACPNSSLVAIHVTKTSGTFDEVEIYGPGF